MLSTFKHAPWSIICERSFEGDWEVGFWFESDDVEGMDVVPASFEALRSVFGLVGIGLGGEVPGVAVGVDDTSGGGADGACNVVTSWRRLATNEKSKGNMHR